MTYNSAMFLVVLVLNYLALAVTVAAVALALLLLVRMLLQWAQANQFGWFALNIRRVTEPVIRPFRFGFDNRMLRFDMIPIVAAALVLINGLFAAWIIGQVASVVQQLFLTGSFRVGNLLSAVVWLAVVLYMAALFARFLLPMLGVGYSNRFLRVAFQMTEPVLRPLRRHLVFGAFDLSPLVVIFLVQLVGSLLREWLRQL